TSACVGASCGGSSAPRTGPATTNSDRTTAIIDFIDASLLLMIQRKRTTDFTDDADVDQLSPETVQPCRYARRTKRFASGTFLKVRLAASHSSAWSLKCVAIPPSNTLSVSGPE